MHTMEWNLLWAALAILSTAVLSSACTLGAAVWFLRKSVRPQLEAHIDQRVDEAIDALGDEVEARVRQGVADGLIDGVAALPSAEVVRGATRTAARSGVDLLSSILGGGRRDPSDPSP
ncbi:MAG: hypothetical protein AAGE94_00885 [Acidobacteriota bacterium]